MQLTPRYLVKNRILIISNEVGIVTEYQPVYQRTLQVYRGIDNDLEFQVLNADQKPVALAGKQIVFVAFDANDHMIVRHTGTVLIANKGLVKVTLTENDLLNVKQQYIRYNVYVINEDDSRSITYANEHFDANGIIYVSSEAFPGPRASIELTHFNAEGGSSSDYLSDPVNAEPGLNGNEAVHTAAIYTNQYTGDIAIEATLENQIDGQTSVEWTEIERITFDGTEEDPVPVNFVGIFSFIRFRATANPDTGIEKILIRN